MDESSDWASQPSLQSQHGQRSDTKNLVSSPPLAIHRRTASDGVPLASRPLPDNTFGPIRPSSESLRSREWLPIMGAARPASPLVTATIVNWQDDGDLGAQSFMMPPNLTPDASSRQKKPGSLYESSEPSRAPRPRPAPMQFEDVAMDHQSPVTSSQSIFSPRDRFRYSRTDSRTNLLNTPSTVWRSPRTPPPDSTMMSSPRKWWYWRPAWFMYMSFIFGVACAIGHHVFYASLNGKPAVDQLAMLRYGTVLSFAAKAGLVAAVVIAFKQRIWTTVKNKFLSVAALDSLFAATEDASALLNIEIYKQEAIL